MTSPAILPFDCCLGLHVEDLRGFDRNNFRYARFLFKGNGAVAFKV